MKLAGARALITGASSGIGSATALLLARAGATPLLTGRDATALDALAKQTDGAALAVDLGGHGAAQTLADWAVETAGGVDLLVCNAGVGWAGDLAEMPAAKLDELIEINLATHLRLTRLLLPAMVRRGSGQLVFVSSIAGSLGVADEAVYAGTKAALRTFAGSLRLAVAKSGVGVSVVVPGVVATPFFNRRGTPYDRTRPKPIPAEAVARALVDAVVRNRSEVFAPGWLRFPARFYGVAPDLVHALQRRFG
ncbi:MAG TPA: SDR family NAD(P)-dependent oxidoreductase [Pseudonocardiaceae bacterium]|nr:SDR family NAD(P)-dependent oxidoreductase [Pseudonocardiaceae bacterium]